MAALQSPTPALAPAFPTSLPDATLVRLVAAGSDDAFAALDARYRRRLVRYAARFAAGGAAESATPQNDGTGPAGKVRGVLPSTPLRPLSSSGKTPDYEASLRR